MSSDTRKDTLYADPHQSVADFAFDERVATVFPDMIRRSVPGYGPLTGLLGHIAGEYAQAGSRLYDLGCSLGAATLAMRRRIDRPGCRIIAVDNSAAMVERCRDNVEADQAPTPVEVVCADIRDVAIEQASVVVMNFTLQFIDPPLRLPLLRRIHAGLLPGGILILAEKLRFADEAEQAMQERLHLAFKRANGYSELEISQKRAALERVLLPDTLEEHRARLAAAGFSQVWPWFQTFNFAALIAVR
jgi:tRNA (cmo5U34)-methyltransferase